MQDNQKTASLSQLIPVSMLTIGGIPQNSVNTRDLYGVLGVGRDFSNWLKKLIEDFGFIENEDYQVILIRQNGRIKTQQGGDRKSTEYHLTLDMAKKLAMLSKSERGRKIRKCIIDCERLAKQTQNPSVNATLPNLLYSGIPELNRLIGHRIWYWTLEKRDRIYHSGIDRAALWQINLDIRAHHSEMSQEVFQRFPVDIDHTDPRLLAYITSWQSSYFDEMTDAA